MSDDLQNFIKGFTLGSSGGFFYSDYEYALENADEPWCAGFLIGLKVRTGDELPVVKFKSDGEVIKIDPSEILK